MLGTALKIVLWDRINISQLSWDMTSRCRSYGNVIAFTWFWYLIKRTTNSTGIPANWINCLLYKVLLNLPIFPVLKKKNCTEPYLGPLHRSYVYIFILIKIIVQFFECKIPERVLLTGAISIRKKFSIVSHWYEAGLSLLAFFTFRVFTLTPVLYSKRKSGITAPAPLTAKLISKPHGLQASETQRY